MPGAAGPRTGPGPRQEEHVVAGIADLAEHSRTREVPELGNRGPGSGHGKKGGREQRAAD